MMHATESKHYTDCIYTYTILYNNMTLTTAMIAFNAAFDALEKSFIGNG